MSKDKKGYSIIEGCIRQSLDLPIKKDKDTRVYVDDNLYLSSSHKSDHEYMDRREKDKYKNCKMPWEKEDD
jgi:hypothetical protein|tara:strand:+ start:561 stop:773 length:213 start_codon:yes stop_codon:yes gene_type:complete